MLRKSRHAPTVATGIPPAIGCILAGLLLVAAPARSFDGDLDGDSYVTAADEALLAGLYGTVAEDPGYDRSGDLNDDGRIDVSDLAIFGETFGTQQGFGDVSPPTIFLSLNDIPDDMNDLLVVPPDGFQITIGLESAGGSLIDPTSLEVVSALDFGPLPAGSDLGPLFQVNASHASWQVPAGSDLARTTHAITARVRDLAGNQTEASYEFAVRKFPSGQPLGETQEFFLDFGTDRGYGTFTDDLRDFGLTSALEPQFEEIVRDELIAEILRLVRRAYGLEDDGGQGADSVNVTFTSTPPAGPHNRLCVGGISPQANAILGLATTDVNNIDEYTDECEGGSEFGVFPQAITTLWGNEAGYVAAFSGTDPELGGTPVGEHLQDALLLGPAFNPANPTLGQVVRLISVLNASNAFARILAVAIAHETGHMLGLTAPGPAPAGLYGGVSGGREDHNVTVQGGTPGTNFIMNPGGSFDFAEVTGTGGQPIPVFRKLNWAYLRDRVALSQQVTGLYPPPLLSAVSPNPASFPQGQTTDLTLFGDAFIAPVFIDLVPVGGGVPLLVLNATLVDPQTITGTINKFLVGPGLYDVVLINGDGQETVLAAGLEVE